MSTTTDPITGDEARALVKHAAALLRSRPEDGSYPDRTKAWLDSVAEFLHSPDMLRASQELGVRPPRDFDKAVEDQSPALDHVAQMLDPGEDNPALLVAGAVGAAYIGLVGYAIYRNITQTHPE